MKGIGIVLIVAGCIWAAIAFNMGISIEPDPGLSLYTQKEVINLGLINRKSSHMFGAATSIISGILLFGFGSVVEALHSTGSGFRKPKPITPAAGNSDAQAEPAKTQYSTKYCTSCFKQIPIADLKCSKCGAEQPAQA